MSSEPLFIRPEARQDLTEASDWYDRQREGLGREFLASVLDRLADIEESPHHFAAGYRGIRSAGVERFPYVIHFLELNGRVEVIAVHHGSRSPAAWRRRIR